MLALWHYTQFVSCTYVCFSLCVCVSVFVIVFVCKCINLLDFFSKFPRILRFERNIYYYTFNEVIVSSSHFRSVQYCHFIRGAQLNSWNVNVYRFNKRNNIPFDMINTRMCNLLSTVWRGILNSILSELLSESNKLCMTGSDVISENTLRVLMCACVCIWLVCFRNGILLWIFVVRPQELKLKILHFERLPFVPFMICFVKIEESETFAQLIQDS